MSTLLEQASLVLIPSGYKEDTVYSVIPSNGSGDMSFTRASDGTRINSAGLVEVVPWNLMQYSNAFNTAPWTMNVTSGQAGKDGQNNAWLLTKSGASTSDFYNSNIYNGDQTFTIYVKKESGKGFKLFPIGTTTQNTEVNLQTGAVYFSTAGITSTTVEAYSSTWWKISVALNMINSNYYIYVTDGAGTQIASSITIQDAQVNIGFTAKPYFPTTDRLNVPRLTYQNGGGGCPSLLLEPQRTNLATYSEDFTNVVYTKTNVSATANTTTALNGIQNADSILELATTTTHESYQRISMTSTQQYTQSCFLKANGRNRVCMQIFDNTTQYASAIYDLSTGVVVSSSGTAKIESMGNGWYRCAITGTSPATGLGYCVLGLCENTYTNSSVMQSYLGDITKGVYWWGFQLELGSYATSYIPTTSSSATRIADACFKTGISSLIGQTEGTIFVEGSAISTGSGSALANSGYLFAISDNTLNNQISIRLYPFDGNYYLQVRSGGGLVAGTTYSPTSVGQNVKIAIAYKANDFAFYVNGTQIATASSGAVPALSAVNFGQFVGPLDAIVNQKQAILFKTRLTNSELAQITTI